MVLLAACAGRPHAGLTAPPPPPAGPDAGRLLITQVRVGTAVPAEGAVSYLSIARGAGPVLLQRELPGSGKLTLKLDPGSYRLASWQRTCDGNCASLDPPSSRCARAVTIAPRAAAQATIRVSFVAGCVIVLRAAGPVPSGQPPGPGHTS
jgi:hypothetical protein